MCTGSLAATTNGDRRNLRLIGSCSSRCSMRPCWCLFRTECLCRAERRAHDRRIIGSNFRPDRPDDGIELHRDLCRRRGPSLVLGGQAFGDRTLDARLSGVEVRERLRPHIDFHGSITRNRVHRCAAFHHADRICRLRVRRYLHVGDQRDRASHGVNRALGIPGSTVTVQCPDPLNSTL